MNALTKFSIAVPLLLATAIAAYLYVVLDDEGFGLARSRPQDEICKQDGERLARLKANPSLDEGLRFLGEMRCPQLSAQLQTILDGLSDPATSNAVSGLNGAAPDTRQGSSTAPALVPSQALDGSCKHDEDLFAELRAKPSVDAAIRFESELRCPRLEPQALALLGSLSQAPQFEGPSGRNGAPPRTNSVGELAQSPLAPPTPEAASTASDDACKRDEGRLRHNPSSEESARFAEELSCEKLRPQLSLASELTTPPPGSGRVSNDVVAETNTATGASHAESSSASVSSAASEADADRGVSALERERDAFAAEVARLNRRGDSASPGQAESTVSRQQAIAAEPSNPEPAPQAIVDAERRIAALEGEEEALAAEVDRLQRDQEAPSAQYTSSTTQFVVPAEPSIRQPASQAAAGADRRIAALERKRGALAADVDRFEHQRDSGAVEQAEPGSPQPPAGPAERADLEPSAAMASLPDDMPARVLIRYPRRKADARRQAESLAEALKKQGVEVADLRESDGAVETSVSFFYARDAAVARRIGGLVGVAPARRPQMRDGLMARPGAIELSFSGDIH